MGRRKAESTEAASGILGAVPSVAELEQRLAELEMEAARVRTLLAAVRQMQGSRQVLPELAELDETA